MRRIIAEGKVYSVCIYESPKLDNLQHEIEIWMMVHCGREKICRISIGHHDWRVYDGLRFIEQGAE